MAEQSGIESALPQSDIGADWAHALAAPIAALEVLEKSATGLDGPQKALLAAAVQRLKLLQSSATGQRAEIASAQHGADAAAVEEH